MRQSVSTSSSRHKVRHVGELIVWWWNFYIRSTLTEQRRRRRVVQAVVLQGDQVLLIKRTSPRVWELPGGGVEDGESLVDAIAREVCEESGVQVHVERKLGIYQRLGFRPHDGIVFVCTPTGGKPGPGDEALVTRFFPIDRLPRGLLPWYRQVIHDATQPIAPPRVHRQWLGPGAIIASLLIVLGEHLHLLE